MARGSVKPIQRKGKDGRAYTVWRAPGPAGESGDGRRRQLTKVHPTRKAAEKWVAEQLAGGHAGAPADAATMTVAELLDRWLAIHARRVGTNTAYSDQWAAKRIRDALGGIRIRSLSVLRVQGFYDGLQGDLKPSSVKVVHRVLKQVLDLAVDWELIGRNPAKAARRPPADKPEPAWWEPASVQTFLDHTRDDFDGPLWALILATGLRIGEAVGLEWRDVDLAAGKLTVSRTMTRDERGRDVVGTTTKSAGSRRTIVLPLPAQVALKRQQAAQERRRAGCRGLWLETGAVFDRGDGKRRDMRSARERFARIVKDLGLPPLTPHGLRHTVASYLFQRRVPALLISRLLGHASVAITQDLYTHISDDDRGEVARAIEGALGDERTERVS
jgi:integrase